MAKSINEFYITIKSNNIYYRFLKCEEGRDGSFYIRHIIALHTKSSYHSNFGKQVAPYEFHLYGCSGEKIHRSVSSRKLFITEYKENPFLMYNFDKIEDGDCEDSIISNDTVFDLDSRIINDFSFNFFSDYRQDLLENNFDNTMAKEIKLTRYRLIVGLSWKKV